MIQFLANQLKANKGRLPINFRPTGGKWHRGVLVGVDQLGMVVVMGKGQVSVLPWGGLGVINIGSANAGQAPAAGAQGQAADKAATASKPAAAGKGAAKNGKAVSKDSK